jgi:CRISPR-associated protein Cmr5
MTATTEAAKPTLEQRRARHAWEAVRDVVQAIANAENEEKKTQARNNAEQFCGQAKRLPMQIIAAGLGQALTFLLAKKYAPELLIAVGDWVLDKRANPTSQQKPPEKDALIIKIINGNSDFLRRATDETLAYLRWVVRFADAQGLTDDTPEGGH